MDLSYVMGNSLLSYLTLLGQAFMNAGLRWRYLSIWSFWGPEFLRREAHVELTCIHFVCSAWVIKVYTSIEINHH